MKKFNVIKLTTSGNIELGSYDSEDGTLALKKALRKHYPDKKLRKNPEDIDFIFFVGEVR